MLDVALAVVMFPAVAMPYVIYRLLRGFKYKGEQLRDW